MICNPLMADQCSKGYPCERCLEAWAANSQSRTLTWKECVRTKFTDLEMFGPGAVCKLWFYALNTLTVEVYYPHYKRGSQRFVLWKTDAEHYKRWLNIISIAGCSYLFLLCGHANKSRAKSCDNLLLANIMFRINILSDSIPQFGGNSVDNQAVRSAGRLILDSLEEALSVRQLVTFSRNQYEGLLFLLLITAFSVVRLFRFNLVSNSFTLD